MTIERKKCHQTVEAESREEFSYKRNLGWLWPVKTYIEAKGKRPSPKDITVHTISGKKIRGVVLGLEHGQPKDGYEISTSSSSGAVKRAQVVASDDSSGVEEMWTAAQKRNRVSNTRICGKDGNPKDVISLKRGFENMAEDGDSSDPDAVLDSIWGGPRFSTSGAGDESDDGEADAGGGGKVAKAKPPRKKKQARATTPTAKDKKQSPRVKTTADASTAAPSSSASAIASPSKPIKQMQVEYNKSEQVALRCDQLIQSLADDEVLLSITSASVKKTIAALDSRLTTDLVKLYAADFSASSSESRGMLLLDRLRKLRIDIATVPALVDNLTSSSGPDFSAEALRTSLAATRTQVKVALKADEVCAVRHRL